MSWMWVLLAIVVVLVVAGLLVVRARGNAGPEETTDHPQDPGNPGMYDTAGAVDPAAAAAGAHTPSPDAAAPAPEVREEGGNEPGDEADAASSPGADTSEDPAATRDDRAAASTDTTSTDTTSTDTTSTDATAGGSALDRADAASAPEGTVPAGVPEPRSADTTAPPIPEQQPGPGDEPPVTGRHALPDDVAPQPLPEVDVPEQAGPLPVPSRSGRGTASTGGSALAGLDSRLVGPAAASTSLPTGVRPGPHPGSVLAPTDGSEPPDTHQVKVHSGSRRFHTPDSPYYVRTRADLYFADEQEARDAGFIAWHEHPGAR